MIQRKIKSAATVAPLRDITFGLQTKNKQWK